MPAILSVKEAKERRQEKLDQMEAMESVARDEKRDLTDDELTTHKALFAEWEAMAADVEYAEKIEKAKKESVAVTADPVPPQANVTVPATPKDHRSGFRNVGEQLHAIMKAGTSGYQEVDPRLKKILAAAGSDEQRIASDPAGGFLIAEEFIPDLLTTSSEADPTAGLITTIPVMGTVCIPARVDKTHTSSVSGGFTVARTGETQQPTASNATFEQVKLDPTMLIGLCYVTEQLLARSPISIPALLEASFAQELQSQIFNERISGTGVGEQEGILNSPCLISVARNTGSDIKGVDISTVRSRVYGYNRAIWLANHDCYSALSIAHRAATNTDSLLFTPGNGTDVPDTLLGRPIFFTEYAKSLGSAGDLICGDWSQYLHGVMNGGTPQQAESMHVRFLEHERAFKFWIENDGRCWWRSALTPVVSSTTLSPFVTIAA